MFVAFLDVGEKYLSTLASRAGGGTKKLLQPPVVKIL
jgi:hypothetical protein